MPHPVGIFFLSMIVLLLLSIIPYLLIRKKKKGFKIYLILYVLILIFLARFWVELLSPEYAVLNVSERFFDSVIHTLQTFSMDEGYTEYILQGKEILQNYPVWADVYGFVISVLNVCAPILGGAILLDILMDIFPHLRLRFSPHRPKFVFSELNSASLTLMEDIQKPENLKILLPASSKPLFIFTDVYSDPSSEEISELKDKAGSKGALCLSNDISELSLRKSEAVYYFLMDDKFSGNVDALKHLLTEENGHYLWPVKKQENTAVPDNPQQKTASAYPTSITVFVKGVNQEKQIEGLIKNSEAADNLLIKPVDIYRSQTMQLLREVPLFTPLFYRDKHQKLASAAKEAPRSIKDLHITILGTGKLTSYLLRQVLVMGQMLDVRLHLSVCGPKADILKQKIENSCNELMESCTKTSSILEIYPSRKDSPCAEPYAETLEFIMMREEQILSPQYRKLLKKTDYFILSTKNENRNIQLARDLDQELQRMALTENFTPKVIAFRTDRNLSSEGIEYRDKADKPYLYPFGTAEEIFSFKNSLLDDKTVHSTHEKYSKKSADALISDPYNYWSTVSRIMHAPYKIFSAGLLSDMILQKSGDPIYKTYTTQENLKTALSEDMKERLAWLEHRRWCIYLRSEGFRRATDQEHIKYFEKTGIHKNLQIKLHPCLCESALFPDDSSDPESIDALGTVEKNFQQEYKKYDYIEFDDAFNALIHQ